MMTSALNRGYEPQQIDKYLQELAWREYFQRVWQARGDGIWEDLKQAQPGVVHEEMIDSVSQGNTGITALDDQIRELPTSGYMHNHVRMYTASVTCNLGKADWRTPARWLYYHLLDGDLASNNCSWQWVSGAFSTKKYYFDQENLNKYTRSKQRHTFIDRSYDAIAAMPIPETLLKHSPLSLHTSLPVTEFPRLDTRKPTAIYNSYNLDPQWRKAEHLNRILLLEPSHFQQYPVSERIIQFVRGLSKNIKDIQLYVGEIGDIAAAYPEDLSQTEAILSKEHPAFTHYPGIKDSRDWMFPDVTGFYPSFSAYWKECAKLL
jgi:deoxyribodipyrimidine photo-lyase